ncbi:response regulator transcription factor [sulfur-oxidizing endosymbiont of Gigantopelta aegis]|uniref:response regulator transcription factor n=1 Tax=sulfur-oxidizing endosymbiont of Gigantopelta aegis TaxID=2794934 RepID=UPI0018DC0A66|nr:response regulator transcription factor [sulfur-oxidizing endosymbiont of Gigantopelta aegis]
MNKIKLFILAQTDIFLEGLLHIFKDNHEIQVNHSNQMLPQLLKEIEQIKPDVLLIQSHDVESPYDLFFNQYRAQHLPLEDKSTQLKILVFGQVMENDFLLNIIRSGANGYINSNMSSEHLIQAIKYVHNGGLWAENHILEQLAQDALQMESILEEIAMEKTRMISELLTKREAQVFQWILKGLSTKEIAGQIHLSEQSVKLHLGKLFKKFEVTNRPQLILSAFERVSPVNNIIPLIQAILEKKNSKH